MWKKQLKQEGKPKKTTTITVYRIERVHPKIVTVTLADNTDAILPIDSDTYAWLVKLVNANPRRQGWYPLIFTLDEKQYVIDVYPHGYERNEQGKLIEKRKKHETVEDTKATSTKES